MNALENTKILDLSEKQTICLTTLYLSSYGTEVTKVEWPGRLGQSEKLGTDQKGDSLYFNHLNRGKKSIILDITTAEGTEILEKLIPFYDVICVGAEAGYMESLGLGYGIIYASYSYYGEVEPYKNKPVSTLTAQVKCVAMDMTGVYNKYPVQYAPSIAEHDSTAYFATGIVMDLIDWNSRGISQKVDIALLDSIYSYIEAAPEVFFTKRKGDFEKVL